MSVHQPNNFHSEQKWAVSGRPNKAPLFLKLKPCTQPSNVLYQMFRSFIFNNTRPNNRVLPRILLPTKKKKTPLTIPIRFNQKTDTGPSPPGNRLKHVAVSKEKKSRSIPPEKQTKKKTVFHLISNLIILVVNFFQWQKKPKVSEEMCVGKKGTPPAAAK